MPCAISAVLAVDGAVYRLPFPWSALYYDFRHWPFPGPWQRLTDAVNQAEADRLAAGRVALARGPRPPERPASAGHLRALGLTIMSLPYPPTKPDC